MIPLGISDGVSIFKMEQNLSTLTRVMSFVPKQMSESLRISIMESIEIFSMEDMSRKLTTKIVEISKLRIKLSPLGEWTILGQKKDKFNGEEGRS